MKLRENQYYTTSYLLLAVALSYYFPVEGLDKTNPDEVEFMFPRSKELDTFVERFWKQQTEFEPISFENQRKSLLRRINELKR